MYREKEQQTKLKEMLKMRKVIGYTVTNGIIFKASGNFSKMTGEFQQGSYNSEIVKAATLKHYKKDTFRGFVPLNVFALLVL